MNDDRILSRQEDDWQVLQSFLPEEWQEQARKLGALRRCRKFANAEALLRTLLIHLADGCSLRETVVRAKRGQLVSVSDVALLKRLKSSGDWLRWMAKKLMERWVSKPPASIFAPRFRVRMIEGSSICEPGPTGSDWRVHYAIGFPNLQCDEVHVSSPKVGESFKRFSVRPGDLLLGGRGYARPTGIGYVVGNGGEVLVRLHSTALLLEKRDGAPFSLLEHLSTLRGTKLGDWEIRISNGEKFIPGRICALKKNQRATEKARAKVARYASKNGRPVKPETLELAGYIFLFTTLKHDFSPAMLLEMYRGRWQIELAFKRLKSIIGLGHLKKTDPEAAKAWIHGKLFVAFLIEALIAAGGKYSPWGYPMEGPLQTAALPLEGNVPDASFA